MDFLSTEAVVCNGSNVTMMMAWGVAKDDKLQIVSRADLLETQGG